MKTLMFEFAGFAFLGPLCVKYTGEIRTGRMEVVPSEKTADVWNTLIRQELLSKGTLEYNLNIANEAWTKAGRDDESVSLKKEDDGLILSANASEVPISGLGEQYDEEDDSLVYKTDVKVAHLSDQALRSWVATFLLGSPSSGRALE
jgi:hypothetical protein